MRYVPWIICSIVFIHDSHWIKNRFEIKSFGSTHWADGIRGECLNSYKYHERARCCVGTYQKSIPKLYCRNNLLRGKLHNFVRNGVMWKGCCEVDMEQDFSTWNQNWRYRKAVIPVGGSYFPEKVLAKGTQSLFGKLVPLTKNEKVFLFKKFSVFIIQSYKQLVSTMDRFHRWKNMCQLSSNYTSLFLNFISCIKLIIII